MKRVMGGASAASHSIRGHHGVPKIVIRVSSQFSSEVNLARDFNESARRVEVLAGGILRHRFDHRVGQALPAEIIECVFDELASESLTSEFGRDGEVWDAAFAGDAINQRGDVTSHGALRFGYEDAVRVGRYILVEMPGLAPSPVVPVQHAQRFLDILFERDASE
jgi:hypothetical protein